MAKGRRSSDEGQNGRDGKRVGEVHGLMECEYMAVGLKEAGSTYGEGDGELAGWWIG